MFWNAALYQSKHTFVFKHGESLLELLWPAPGEGILDLGCGTRELTCQTAAASAQVMRLDLDDAML